VPGSGLPQLWRGLPDALLLPRLASQQPAQQIERPPEPGSGTVPPAVLSPVQPAAVAAADERKLVAPGRQAVLCVSPEDAEPGQERERDSIEGEEEGEGEGEGEGERRMRGEEEL